MVGVMRSGGVIARGAAVALVGSLIVVSASTTAIAGAPPGSPALDRMALAVSDLAAGGSIRRQGYIKDSDFVAYYIREFKPGASLGRSALSGLESDVGVTMSRADAAKLVARIATTLRSKSARRTFVRGALQDAGWPQASLRIGFGGISAITGGDAAFIAPLKLSFPGTLRLSLVLEVVRVDRAVQVLYLLSVPNTAIVSAEAIGLIGIVAARMRAGLIPAATALPTTSGTLQVGETLSAAVGSWTNAPTVYGLQWLRCSAAGTDCVPLDGAVATDYVLTTADVGSTIEVRVVATNAAGSSEPAVSAPSGIVGAAAPG